LLIPTLLLPTLVLSGDPASAQVPKPEPPLAGSAVVQVTATRFPEDPAKVPGSITVITGKDLADRGVADLRSALALVAGVQIAPGGDGGPAASVPAFWGLKEFDAFLLVVDGVPWGGAFNPSLATLDLHDVERIEVQRGAAPVMYGATSFVGVIHVIHKQPADRHGSAEVSAGSHGSGGATVGLRLPAWAGFDSSLAADIAKQGFSDPRTGFTKSHLLWRNRMVLGEGSFHFDLDGVALDQQPASPSPRSGKVIDPRVPVDANHNPDGAYLNVRRMSLNLGYDRALGSATWSTLVSAARTNTSAYRGFLAGVSVDAPNAHGFREQNGVTDVYVDTHLAGPLGPAGKVVLGFDHLHGQGTGRGGDFDYFVNLDSSNPPGSAALPHAVDIRVDDQRDFSGLYGFLEWNLGPSLVLEGGLRINHTRESRSTALLDFESSDREAGQDAQSFTRLSGSAGFNWTFWQEGSSQVRLFGTYRNTFKPAAVDFGLDSEARILRPETAESFEMGVKGRFFGGAMTTELALFRMDMANMVVAATGANGGPVLKNAGQQRFQGAEWSLAGRLAPDLFLNAAYSYHDARFSDFVYEFDPGVPTQLAGNRQEMSPFHLGSLGLTYAPARGFTASVEAAYTGWVWLNKRNSAPAGGFTTLAASLGWRTRGWDLRLSGQNLGDKRNHIAESELGDAQYYRLPGRRVELAARFRF
jgi:outer membrane receptor protein involved in Fe transport